VNVKYEVATHLKNISSMISDELIYHTSDNEEPMDADDWNEF